MKRVIVMLLVVGFGLPAILLTGGCGEKKEVITADKKKQFGTANQPMPPEAREAIMKASQRGAGPPPGAAAPASTPATKP